MPVLVFRHVVSSTESLPGFSADNLLTSNGGSRKWKGKSGVDNNTVILQLEREERVTSVDLGNEGSAFVEVLVARSAEDAPQYFNLIPSTSLMSPVESRNESGTTAVRLFSLHDMNHNVAAKKWDLFKVGRGEAVLAKLQFVCRQPFNNRIPFGLSFVRVVGGEEVPVGEKTCAHEKPLHVKKFSDEASTSFVLQRTENFRKRNFNAEFEEAEKVAEQTRKRQEEAEVIKKAKLLDAKKVKTTEMRRRLKPLRTDAGDPDVEDGLAESPSLPAVKKPGGVKTNKILKEVKFSLSGFQNPERSQIRDLAISMGAVFQDKVDASLTHLVAKFKNTPKVRLLRPNVALVSSSWIEQCAAKQKRLPEHLFPVQ